MRIAVDAMGGDHAPAEIVAGTLLAAAAYPDTAFLLVGDEAAVRGHLPAQPPANVYVHHAPDVIGMDDDPSRAVRRKPQSSLCVACRMVIDGAADAVFSAGNTGAVAAAATLLVGRLPRVHRPCIAAVLPQRGGRLVICDAGASIDSKPEWVQQFGIMAALFAEDVEHVANPRVGLLSIGEEACKGNALTKATHQLLAGAGVNWIGNIDGKDVFAGVADVIACDGFDGNLLLKVSEGAADYFMHLTREALTSSWSAKLGALLVRPGLRGIKRTIDYSEYGGAFLLGVKGLVVIGHGRSNDRAVASALRRTREGIERGLVSHLEARFGAQAGESPAVPAGDLEATL